MAVTPKLPPAFDLVALERVDSTNEAAKRLAKDGAEDGTLVWALEQTAGRGRGGRGWASPPGNLYCSVLTRPDCGLDQVAELGFAACLGVGGALGGLVPPLTDLNYKWPNDVLLNRRKAAGVLLESATRPDGALDYLVIGVGVNVSSCPEDTAFPATSLAAEGAGSVEVATVLEGFCRQFLTWVNRWLDDGFAPLRREWLGRATGLGQAIEVHRGDGVTLHGTFRGLDERGALHLEEADGTTRTVQYGDVFFGGAEA
jgi:BirA family biotin operon repressor/biotin-[acetyl-CoA-carboxylase] ligase